MPAQCFKICPKRQLVSIHWKSAPSIQQWYDLTECILGHPDYVPGMKMIVRRAEALTPVTSAHVREVLAVLDRRSGRMAPVSLAIVAPEPCDFGMARMMETLSESASIVVRAFKRPREAIEWLAHPVRYEPPVQYQEHHALAFA
jgi:hypothetical protein